METVREPVADSLASVDSLANLEERITRAVGLITDLRTQNGGLNKRVAALEEEIKAANETGRELESANAVLLKERDDWAQRSKQQGAELDDMKAERKEVRARIEKLLSQLDLLSAS